MQHNLPRFFSNKLTIIEFFENLAKQEEEYYQHV